MVDQSSRALTAKHRQLLEALREAGPHSGNDLARRLGISRTGVWKAVRHLRQLGMEIDAVPGVGYRLGQPLEWLDSETIRSALTAEAARWLRGIHVHEVLPSTNTFLRDAARTGAPAGTICVAEMQTDGRGRQGRNWQSPFVGNIYLSLLWHFSSAAGLGGLSLAVGVLVVRALRVSGVEGVMLKWPNDILWNDRKLGGVLIEVFGEANGSCAVVIGIGVNCFLPRRCSDLLDQPAVDLRRISGSRLQSRNLLVGAVLNQMLPALADFDALGFAPYLEEWRQYHAFEGRTVWLERGSDVIEGRIRGVTDSGTLLLDCRDGALREFSSGDVRLRSAGG